MTLQQRLEALAQQIAATIKARSLPSGGTGGQVLTKNSATDFDAMWATPSAGGSGTPAGPGGSLQYNNSGAFGGAANVGVSNDGDLRFWYSSSAVPPSVNVAVLATTLIGQGAGRLLPRWRFEDGSFKTEQAHIARNTIVWAQSIGNATTAPVFNGMLALTALGTATARSVATTNRLTRARRTGYVSAATAGAAAGLYNVANNTQWTTGGASGGGFMMITRFGVSDAALVAGAHQFIGMTSNTAAPVVATSPATFTNSVGLAQVNGSTNWQIVFGGSAAQNPVDTGCPVALNTEYELILYSRIDNNGVGWRLENINNGLNYSGMLAGGSNTTMPANTVLMGPRLYRSNNATAAAVGLDFITLYIESDL